ncbi:MFS general substrate transporter [Neurospora crassa]|uniref:Membrane transporter n=1 Tax=Neurospora crassa (strain ATCC 24698 / 74-OR23-1A / CBS 708.71 / DSM 1257 / FGSC 987) TaxID=367110 RepID=Q7S6Y3_NEUCR|nr:membrane transporter [Neurospora crassa OR74A]EAA31306.1 membrane transporter [Neurospora crassa OR74A]KHE86732.1 MFS general substrate transporter [Neurospora crassa]|eukprot:XP_960542.1 membrane transporter [Neurospora crassa OR74A]
MADSKAQTPRDSGTFDKERPLDFDVEKGEQSESDGATIQAHSERGVSTHTGDKEKAIAEETEQDPNIVDWDGPDDPENPMNWPDKKKWLNVAVLSILTIITPLGSSMFAPGVKKILVEFHETSSTTATFLVSIYILGFAFGPLLVAPLSEMYGRAPLYNFGNILFTIFTVGTALSKNTGMLLAFRFLMGLAGSVPITIGSGSIADCMTLENRGKAMSAWALGPLLGPCIGPIAGGYLIRAAGWRWVFWLITIIGGCLIPFSFFCLRETYAPVLLERKAARLRKETGNPNLRSKLASKVSATETFKIAIARPMKLLIFEPIITFMSLYVAIIYGILYMMFTTFTFVYSEHYGFDEGSIGLAYLPTGIGMFIGVSLFGYLSDKTVRDRQAKGLVHRPEVRLIPWFTIPCGLLLVAGLFIYGWTVQEHIHWIVPMLGVLIFCGSLMGIMMSVQSYLLEAFLTQAASVTAALAVLRSLLGALLPLGALDMYQSKLHFGWGNSLLGFIALALAPIPFVFYVYGERLRKKSGFNKAN